MNSFKAIYVRFLPLVLLSAIWTAIVAMSPAPQFASGELGDFVTKPYYTKIFDKNELKILAGAQKDFAKGESNLKKADTYFAKADGYRKIAEQEIRPKDIEKNEKKAAKNAEKALKYAFKAFDDLLPANQRTFDVYRSKLKSTKVNDELIAMKVEHIQQVANDNFAKGEKIRQQAASANGIEKYNLMQKSDSLQFKALKLQETAFGLIHNDKDAKYDLPDDKNNPVAYTDTVKNDTTKQDSTKTDTTKTDTTKNETVETTETYNPDKDENLYKSKADLILPKLNLTAEEKKEFTKAEGTRDDADALMSAADVKFKELDALKEQLKDAVDEADKKKIEARISDKEILLYAEMIKAANLYLQSSENQYNIYKAHYSDARPKNAPEKLKKGAEYEKNAATLYETAKSTTAGATFQTYRSDEYLMLMEALQSALFAVQEQENAYSVYFDFTVVPLPDAKVTGNEGVVKTDTTDTKASDTKKYNYAGSFIYTSAAPEHKPLKHPKGLIYRVQVGVFSDTLSAKKYKKYEPITYDAFKNNPHKRYMFGEYKTTSEAETKLIEIQKTGFKDAYIVAYSNGKRISYKKVKEAIVADENRGVPESTDTSEKKYRLPELNYGTDDYDFVKGIDVSTTKGLIYTVQFGLYKLPKTNMEIKHIQPLLQEVTSEGVKYMQGTFATYEKAVEAKSEIVKKGFDAAFVSAYHNGVSVSVSNAKKMQAGGETKKTEPKAVKVYYTVQIGAYASALTPDVQQKFDAISKTHTIVSRKDTDTGLTVYSVGNFTNYNDATAEKNKLKAAGYTDVFLQAYKDEQKITIKEAVELTK